MSEPSEKREDSFVKISKLIGGEEYEKVATALLETEDATDEEIATATGMRINIIRKVLYDMFGKALITGIRVKDEKKGWFVYRWIGLFPKRMVLGTLLYEGPLLR